MGQFESFIGVDFWTALFILLNTLAIFVVARKYLFTPIHNMIESRQKEIDQMYADAEKAKSDAKELRSEYEAKISGVRQEADRVIKTATESANARDLHLIFRTKFLSIRLCLFRIGIHLINFLFDGIRSCCESA